MLEHSPPLPLIIDYIDDLYSITTEDKGGIMLALKHRDRVRRIRLHIPGPNMQKIIMALEDEFPILEFLYITPPTKLNTCLILPKSFRVPDLHHLVLRDFAFPIGSPLLTTATGLVTLWLEWISPSVYFHPNDLVHWLSQIPHLETLGIAFSSPVPNHDLERELLRGPLMTHITLPNLRWFRLKGASDYLEVLLSCMTAPLLTKLQVFFINQLTSHLPHLLQFLNTAENLRFSNATLVFGGESFSAMVYPKNLKEARKHALYMSVACRHVDWQVASAAQIFSVLRSAFCAVENLTFRHYWGGSKADRTQWRDLLKSFGDVKTFRVTSGIVSQLSRSLYVEDGESPVELLPELKELSYPNRPEFDDVFTPFIDARRIAGCPVTVVRHNHLL
ncbi:hypothetical protein BC827DRAFT_1158216 [Russula dissimulans]|nr:hypothetical protein BC827DRAFT_1158216 [Russula dissimulans]